MDFVRQLCAYTVDIIKIYLKFALVTLVIYFVAEYYILHYGAELEAQLDAAAFAAEARAGAGTGAGPEGNGNRNERPPANSTVGKVFRFILNFFII